MGFKETVVVGATVVGLVVGVNQMLAPKTPQEFEKQRQEQRYSDLADSEEQQRDRRRDKLSEDIDADREDRLRPGEHRPRPQGPKIRLRLP